LFQFKKNLAKAAFSSGVALHNFGYKLISKAILIMNDDVHPKHSIMNYHDYFKENIKKTDLVLDIGCGNGLLAADIAKKAKSVKGVDIVSKNIKKAKKREQKNLSFVVGDATKYKFSEAYDVVVLSNVLEHIEKRVAFLKKIIKLAPRLIVRVPLASRSWLAMYLREEGYDYKLDKTHFVEYTESEIRKELEKAGLKILTEKIMWGEYYCVCQRRK